MGVVFRECQGRCLFRKGGDVHSEEIYRELTVDVVELILVLPIVLFQIRLVDLLQVVEIIRTLGINTLVDDEVLPVFFGDKGMAAVGTLQGQLFLKAVFTGREKCTADLALVLAFGAVVPVKIGGRGMAGRTGAAFRYVALLSSADRADRLSVFPGVIAVQILPVPVLMMEYDLRQTVALELLIFRGMRIVKVPLF